MRPLQLIWNTMALGAGARLGPYEIVALIGAGGMGEVYRARDTRLDRIVAIKVLPPQFAADPQFRERFDREAKAISSLNHPHICTLYDVGHQDGADFLVMELIGGETLAARLTKGALPLDQALKMAIEIASALDTAHRAGIVHRDMKPGNVMLTKTGAKLLDFGLAKAEARGAGRAGGPGGAIGLSMLPTTPNLTAHGTILGTFQYMAPEQLEGQDADARSDIFGFGAVLYEMITGKKAFEGKSQASLISAIMASDPAPIVSFAPLTPPVLDRIARKCLAKDPDDRWQTAHDLVDELKWTTEARSHATLQVSAGPLVRPSGRERIAWMSSLALATLIAGVMTVWALRPGPAAPEIRLEITTPPTTDPASIAISPDGRRLVFIATSEGVARLWVRALDAVSSRPLSGTDGATYPFWSPDNRSVGFFADSKLKRIDINGGPAQTLASAGASRGGAWNRDGVILFAPLQAAPIFRVRATGGEPVAVTKLEAPQQVSHRFPQFLPDGRHFLYYSYSSPVRGVYIGQLDGFETRRLVDADAAAVYVSGHLLFVRQGTVFAQDFDPARLVLTGEPVVIAERVAMDSSSSALAALSAAAAGPIVYRSAGIGRSRQFVWFDRSGRELGKAGDLHDGLSPSLSPDGRRVAMQQTVNGNADIWVLELGRGVFTRFTSRDTIESFPIWSADGRHLVFGSNPKGPTDIFWKLETGVGNEELLSSTAQAKFSEDVSSDGRYLLYRITNYQTGYDLWALPMAGDRKAFPVVQTEFTERDGKFSPDAKWLAYQSDESGLFEIYVQPFPGHASKLQISSGGGAQVRWRRDGKELFYVGFDNRLMAVPIKLGSGGTLEAGTPAPLFTTNIGGVVTSLGPQYVVSPDGQRFLMNTVTQEAPSPITIILNWKPASRP